MIDSTYLNIIAMCLGTVLGYMIKPMLSLFMKKNGSNGNGYNSGNGKVFLTRIEENRQAIREHAKDMGEKMSSLGEYFQRIENLLSNINSSIILNTETIKMKFSNFDDKLREIKEAVNK